MTLQQEQSLDRLAHEKSFQRDIDAITSRQLSPENIDSYAEDALDDLVSVVQDITESYDYGPTYQHDTQRDVEVAAFRYHNLDPETIEAILDHVVDVADQIRSLDKVLDQIRRHTENVIVPPDHRDVTITPGAGSFEKKQSTPRLKTLLFILSNEFDVDLHDEQQVRVTTGRLTEAMMRGESYNFVEIPAINRTVLVCDEEGNMTYVFDDERLKASSIQAADLDGLSKIDLNDLLNDEPALGRRIKYTKRYVQNLVEALGDDSSQEAGQFLRKIEPAPDGYKSLSGFAKQLEIDASTLQTVLTELGDELGEVLTYKFKYGAPTKAYSPHQQQLIERGLEQRGVLARLPEDYLPLYGLANAMEVERSTVSRAIDQLSGRLGHVAVGRRKGAGAVASPHYSPEQQVMIREQLENNGSFSGPPPDDFLSIFGMAREFHLDYGVVERARKLLGDELGEAIRAKSATSVTDFYSPTQQEAIRRLLELKGFFASSPPEGYVSEPEMRELFGGVSARMTSRAIESLTTELGKVMVAKRAKKYPPQPFYSHDQVVLIHDWIVRNGRNKKDSKFIRDLFPKE